jgi:hypothetical protein
VPGALRRSRNSGTFSPQPGYPAAYSGDYTGEFAYQGDILAACGAKFTAQPVKRTLSAELGQTPLSAQLSDRVQSQCRVCPRTGSPRREVQSAKFALYAKPRARTQTKSGNLQDNPNTTGNLILKKCGEDSKKKRLSPIAQCGKHSPALHYYTMFYEPVLAIIILEVLSALLSL